MDGIYDNDFSKIALAATAAQMAKSTGVKDLGIGEDLPMNFFAWGETELVAVAQCGSAIMNLPPEERLAKCARLCALLRRYWWATSITMVAEGFCSMDKEKTKGIELSRAFLDPSKPVVECVTVGHASLDDGADGPAFTMVAIPYEYELGRNVIWQEMIVYPDGPQEHFRNFRYPEMLCAALEEKVIDDADDDFYDRLRHSIRDAGFHMQEFI